MSTDQAREDASQLAIYEIEGMRASSPAAASDLLDAGIEEINVPPAGALIIQYKRIKDIGTKLSTWDLRMEKFFDPKAKVQPATLTPGTELNDRTDYMFAANMSLTKKECKAYSLGKGKRAPVRVPLLLHCATFDDTTFFALSFPQGDWLVELEWEELDVESTFIIAKKPGSRDTPNTQPPPKELSTPIDIPNKKDEQYVPQCTSVLVLIPKSDEHLQKSIEENSLAARGYARIQSSNLFHQLFKPLKHYIINTYMYDKDSQEELGEVLKYADNIIFFGHSASSRYLLHTLTDKDHRETGLRTPYLDPNEWPEESKSYRDIGYESAMVLRKIQELNKLSQCCALMMPQGDDGSVLSHTLSAAISSATEAPITPKLYLCWKFTGLGGKSESEYLREVTQFLQSNGIPVIIDAVCHGCVAIIMHGPAWAWHYLTAFSPLIASTFGSDLRSITQMSINSINDLMRRKDNAQFMPLLSKLCLQMARDQVPFIIKKKLSIIFMPVTKLSVANEDEYDIEELTEEEFSELNDGVEDMEVDDNEESIDSANDCINSTKWPKKTNLELNRAALLITKQQFQEGIVNLRNLVKTDALKLKWLQLVDWNLAENSWNLFEKLREYICWYKEGILLWTKGFVDNTIGFKMLTKEFLLHLLLISVTKVQSNRGRKRTDNNAQQKEIQKRTPEKFFFDAVAEDKGVVRVLWNLRQYYRVTVTETETTIHHDQLSAVDNWTDEEQVAKFLNSIRPKPTRIHVKSGTAGSKKFKQAGKRRRDLDFVDSNLFFSEEYYRQPSLMSDSEQYVQNFPDFAMQALNIMDVDKS